MRRFSLVCLLACACSSGSGSSPGDKQDAATPQPMGGTGGTATGGRGGSPGTGGGGSGGTPTTPDAAAPPRDAAAGGSTGARDAGPSDAARDSARDAAAAGNPFVYVSGPSSVIRIYRLDRATGMLTSVGMADLGANFTNPSYLAWDPRKKFLFAINESSGLSSRIFAFSINAMTGALTRINDVSVMPAAGGPHISVDQSGKWVMVAYYGSGHVTVNPIADTGAVGMASYIQKPVSDKAHQIVNDPTGKYVFVPATGPNLILQYRLDATMGMLTPNDPPSVPGPSMPNEEPRHMDFHPSLKYAYAVNERTSRVTSFKFDSATGKLSDAETVAGLPAGFTGSNSGAHILVHPSGKWVYSSNRGHNSISIFAVNEMTGRLTLVGHETGDMMVRTPRDFGIDPTGQFLITGNNASPFALIVFQIDPATGMLTRKSVTMNPTSISFVGIVPLP